MSYSEVDAVGNLGSASKLGEGHNTCAVANGWLAVGNFAENSNDGAVYLYQISGTGEWTARATLNGNSGEANYFGTSVAFDSGADHLFVGSQKTEVNSTAGAGAVKVYTRSGTTWTYKLTLTPDGLTSGDGPEDEALFGYCIRVSGDDSKVFVSAILKDHTVSLNGSVYVFDLGGSLASPTLTEASESPIRPPSTVTHFGTSIALTDDDLHLFIGAQADGSSNGAIYYFELSGGSWSLTQTLTPRILNPGSYFGRNVAVSGNGLRLVAGRSNFRSVGGQVQYFARSSTTASWTLRAEWMFNDGWYDDVPRLFGWDVSMNRGGTRLLVGSPLQGDGAAILYRLDTAKDFDADYLGDDFLTDQNTGCWTRTQTLLPSTSYTDGNFGNCVKLSRQGNLALVVQGRSAVDGSGSFYSYGSTANDFFFHGVSATSTTSASDASTPLDTPTAFAFVNNGGSGYDTEGLSVTFESSDGFTDALSIDTWTHGGIALGACLLNEDSYVNVTTPIENVSHLVFYFAVKQSGYSGGSILIDLSGNGDIEIASSSTSVGGYDVSYSASEATITLPATKPSGILYVNLSFSSPVVISENISVRFS